MRQKREMYTPDRKAADFFTKAIPYVGTVVILTMIGNGNPWAQIMFWVAAFAALYYTKGLRPFFAWTRTCAIEHRERRAAEDAEHEQNMRDPMYKLLYERLPRK